MDYGMDIDGIIGFDFMMPTGLVIETKLIAGGDELWIYSAKPRPWKKSLLKRFFYILWDTTKNFLLC
ncbi:hypothetical protein [Paenibacillus sp. 1_12]|uniref:hypothetical protein n=1 Tax=Paenibacillus sp. 1_12 TaxID=1566278 RepID=UPI0011609298|nr:hypothetical protein [Paenibacillus sp. 1_12]